MMRIASLLPAATKIVEHLGRGNELVAVSHACTPTDASLPRLTRSRVPLALDAAATDARVKELLRRGEPLFELDEDLFFSLEPDVVLSQSLCNVCAIDGNHISRVTKARGTKTKLFEWSPTTLEEVTCGIEQIGQFIDAADAGRAASAAMREQILAMRRNVELMRARPTVVFLEWLNPLFRAGHWIPELVELAGGIELLGEAGGRSREIRPEELAAADPDVIVACCCGWDEKKTATELSRFEHEPWWTSLSAVRSGRVHVVGVESAFTMPGAGLIDDCFLLADLFDEGSAKRRRPKLQSIS